MTPEDYEVLAKALANPPEPNDKLRQLMCGAVRQWDETVKEPLPADFQALLDKLN